MSWGYESGQTGRPPSLPIAPFSACSILKLVPFARDAGADFTNQRGRSEDYCPTLRGQLGNESKVSHGVGSIMEIIMNGPDLPTIARATQAAIAAAVDTPGLIKISAGNYGGRLGKSFIYLLPK